MQMTGFYCASCKRYLREAHEVKTIERGHPGAPGKAVDYMVFVCVNVASLCEGGGSFTNGICFLIYPVHSCLCSDAHGPQHPFY